MSVDIMCTVSRLGVLADVAVSWSSITSAISNTTGSSSSSSRGSSCTAGRSGGFVGWGGGS